MENEQTNDRKITAVDREVSWDKTQVIMSKTNTKGIIEYANDTFVDVSGYEDFELIGQPQNIIRHPDMPKVIFKILWEKLKAGENFHAVIKNMSRTGRYYWVITDFEISKDENGEITNYFARRKSIPNDVIVNHIEPLYKKLLQIENASGIEFSEKYLNGFLEEKNKTYVQYIMELIYAHEKANEPTTKVEEKGFFNRFFGN